MAFQNKNLSVIAYANGFTLWHYSAAETMTTITKTGYFNAVSYTHLTLPTMLYV